MLYVPFVEDPLVHSLPSAPRETKGDHILFLLWSKQEEDMLHSFDMLAIWQAMILVGRFYRTHAKVLLAAAIFFIHRDQRVGGNSFPGIQCLLVSWAKIQQPEGRSAAISPGS